MEFTMTESEYFKSEKFRKDFRKKVEQDTWEKDLPMVYLDENRNIVKHWKDGTIEIVGKAEDKIESELKIKKGDIIKL
jgi:hypothetical protein